jgi:hypothetical protein
MAKRKPHADVAREDSRKVALNAVQQEIAKSNLGWEAGTTDLSNVNVGEATGLFGLAVQDEQMAAAAEKVHADERYWGVMGAFVVPPSIDWRDKDGGDYVKEPRDQGRCQSCVAFAVVGAIEANMRIACRNAAHAIALSETDLFSCGCGRCCDRGWFPDQALRHCQTVGVALLSQVPYRAFDVACTGSMSGRQKIAGWEQLTTRESIKKALVEKGPCVYGMIIFEDFLRYYKSGVYRHAAGRFMGNHAVLIIGYDDAQNCWIIRNSWGTGWGEKGFFRVHYDDVCLQGARHPGSGRPYAFPAFSVTVNCPVPVAPSCSQYVPELKEIIRAGWTNPALKAYLRYWVCGIGPQLPVDAALQSVATKVRAILRTCPESYRTWFCDNLLKK